MKSTLKFIFNLIRNISLIVLIGLIGIAFYLEHDEQEIGINNLFAPSKQQEHFSISGFEDNLFDIRQEKIDEPPSKNYKSKKFKIEVQGGFAYLRPSQIMYINSNSSEIVTTNENRISTKLTLKKLTKLLNINKEECFFRIRTAIINCNYIQQVIKKSDIHQDKYIYQNVIIMENGEEINISKDKAKELFTILDNSSI